MASIREHKGQRPGKELSMSEDKLLKTEEVAEILHVHPFTLASWRCTGRGPSFVKLGKAAVRYRRSDVEHFVERGRVEVKP